MFPLFVLVFSISFAQKSPKPAPVANTSSKNVWDVANYDKSYEEFIELDQVDDRIDFKNINYPLLQACILFETNQQRILNDLPALVYNEQLESAASGHAKDMTKYNFFSHTSVVSGKKSLSDRVKLAGLEPWGVGENIATSFGLDYISNTPVYSPKQNNGYFSYTYQGDPILAHTYLSYAQAVVQQWMNSSGHRANILSTSFKSLGTGCSHYSDKSFYMMDMFHAVQVFSY